MFRAEVAHRSLKSRGLAAHADFCACGKRAQLMHRIPAQPAFLESDFTKRAEPTQSAFFLSRAFRCIFFAALDCPFLRALRPLGHGRIAGLASGLDDERLDFIRRAQRRIGLPIRGDLEDGFELLQEFWMALELVHGRLESPAG